MIDRARQSLLRARFASSTVVPDVAAAIRTVAGEPHREGLMTRLWKLPAALAELTVGTMIVLYQLSVARALERKQLDRPEKEPVGMN